MAWINHFNGFLDFLALVIVYAPDRFPTEDFLRDDEQLTLASAFKELGDGMKFVAPRVAHEAALGRLQSQLDQARDMYRRGDAKRGVRLLQDFEKALMRETGPYDRR